MSPAKRLSVGQEGKANTAVDLTAGEGTPAVVHAIGVENDNKASGAWIVKKTSL